MAIGIKADHIYRLRGKINTPVYWLGEIMEELQSAIKYVVIIVAAIAAIILGDYLGHKFGRMKVVWTSVIVALLAIVVFAIYAAVVLLS
jgi:uncharacterized integral membrane protein